MHFRAAHWIPRPGRVAGWVLFAVFALGFGGGCGTDPPDEQRKCGDSSDCPDDQYCSENNVCVQDCDPEASDPCEGDKLCTDRGECKQESCNGDSDCPSGYYCSEGFCGRDCDPDDGSACTEDEECTSKGRCAVPGECRSDSDCDDPPDDECDGGNVTTYPSEGSCEVTDGMATCKYPPQENATMCKFGCENGMCKQDPCADVTCDSPPPSECSDDGTELITYESPGTCDPEQGGECVYEELPRKGCPNGCENGMCNASACADVTCDSPPSDTCNGNVAVTYEQTGTCKETNNGTTCDYGATSAYCHYRETTCDGASCKSPISQAGGVVVTEYMADPAKRLDAAGEWFEVHNAGSSSVNLVNWTIRSLGNNDHTIANDVNIGAGDRAVLAKTFDPTDDGSVSVAYRYSDIRLSNDSDWLRLVDPNGNVVDHVYYESGTILEGHSRKLDPSATVSVKANDNPTNWCPSLSSGEELPNGEDYGSPGATNPPCSSDPCANFTCQKPDPYCDSQGNAVRATNSSATCSEDELNNPDCDWGVQTFTCSSSERCTDGYCRPVPPPNAPGQGDLVITEIMGDPDASLDRNGEWIEIYNPTSSKLSLFSLVFEDSESGRAHDEYTIWDWNAEVPAGGYAVLAKSTDPSKNGGIQGAYFYDGTHLKNSTSGMTIRLVRQNGTVVDEAYYGEPTTGESQQLSLDKYSQGATDPAGNNDTSANWCAPTSTFGSGDKGSPKADNRICP